MEKQPCLVLVDDSFQKKRIKRLVNAVGHFDCLCSTGKITEIERIAEELNVFTLLLDIGVKRMNGLELLPFWGKIKGLCFLRSEHIILPPTLRNASNGVINLDASDNLILKNLAELGNKLLTPAAYFILRDAGKWYALKHEDLLYVDAMEDYINLNFIEGQLVKKYTLYSTLKKAEKMLEKLGFLRVHRSYLIAAKFKPNNLEFIDIHGNIIPIGKKYAQQFVATKT